MTLHKLIGVPRISGVPGFEMLFDAAAPAKEALEAADAARADNAEVGLSDSYGTRIMFAGADFLFFMMQEVAVAMDGKNEEQIAQLRAQKRGQTKAEADVELNGAGLVRAPSLIGLNGHGRQHS